MAKYTAVFRQDGSWWMGYVEELPGANTQGRTLAEARENLKEAVSLILHAAERQGEVIQVASLVSPSPPRGRATVLDVKGGRRRVTTACHA